ncbi:unnamed protein product [Rotaria sp. Silwood2]|nr:unnamed protein product [Rotaria sp. Silwood2]CAF2986884.1 unnamed protein product [Rotaria sp. Silwood2]CAF3118097.1 unnamed protein product [Rotaria sp. Silwood2]CAF3527540.1 unnamed protein product [Rotaria sp. Silwood2]CAF4126597.1 unnamed protein product [Rotaria sp. Silwood2]
MQTSTNYDQQAKEELDAIRKQINRTTNESLESTHRMVNLVVESDDASKNTMKMIQEQGEQLNRIEHSLGNIDAGMTEAEKNLTDLQKCCGLCVLPWKGVRRTYRTFSNKSKIYSCEKTSIRTMEPKHSETAGKEIPKTGYITRITNDDREVSMENNLQVVSNYIDNLKHTAIDMGNALTNQNEQIKRITDKTDVEIERVNEANVQAKDLLQNG